MNRCVHNKGKWTSGLHLAWWTHRRLLESPEVRYDDLRAESHVPLSRQVKLARWSMLMMRLMLISDVASYAERGDRMGRLASLASLAEQAADETRALSPHKLLRWIERKGERLIDNVLPQRRYEELAAQLHKEEGDPAS